MILPGAPLTFFQCHQPQNVFPMSEFMTDAARRKPGRPLSGKRAYCIRMKPDVYTILVQAAEKAGFNNLGDWFESLAKPGEPGARDQENP